MREGSRYAFLFDNLYAVTLCGTFFSVMHFIDAFPWGGLATGRCGGHAQASRQAKHCAHRGVITLVSCDKAFQDPCHSETREQKYVQQQIRICTHGVMTGLG